jgi:hypothetical protein
MAFFPRKTSSDASQDLLDDEEYQNRSHRR